MKKYGYLLISFLLIFSGCGSWDAGMSNWSALTPEQVLSKTDQPPLRVEAAKKMQTWGAYSTSMGFSAPAQILKISEKEKDSAARVIYTLPQNPSDPVTRALDFSTPGPGNQSQMILHEAVFHFRPLAEEPAPFYTSYLTWSEDRQAEWFFMEAAGVVLNKRGSQAQTQMIRDFLAFQLTAGYLVKYFPGIQTMAESYGALVADRRNFAQLFSGLKDTVINLRLSKDTQESFMKKFDYQLESWVKDFQSKYTTRFQTNEFRDFGKAGTTVLSILAFNPMAQNYSEIERKYRSLKGGLTELATGWNSLSDDPKAIDQWLKQ